MDNLIKMLRQHEGVMTHVYRDSEGLETIGVGRCIADGSLGLNDDEIDYLLTNDINRCKEEARQFSWYEELDTVRREAVLNLLFNLGRSRFMLFKKAIAGLEDHDYDRASDEFHDSRWRTQVGKRAEDICHMIRTGTYPDGFEQEPES
jgi:lysozyme